MIKATIAIIAIFAISSINIVNASRNRCDSSLWQHVYNPERLQVITPCKTVSGTVDSISTEADGDFHIRLMVDPQFNNMINSANILGQHGLLVLEPICMNPVTQADAMAACQNFTQNLTIPQIGQHVNVTGTYVLDKAHGIWAELHPVTNITVMK